jgi:hypothetical protein
MAVNPDGRDLRVVETGAHNGEGLAVVPDGSVWIAVNERDNVTYPFHSSYAGHADAFAQAYVNEHPPDEVVRVAAGRDLGWPYCNPDPDENHPSESLAGVPLVADGVHQPGQQPACLRQVMSEPGRLWECRSPCAAGRLGGQQHRARVMGQGCAPAGVPAGLRSCGTCV